MFPRAATFILCAAARDESAFETSVISSRAPLVVGREIEDLDAPGAARNKDRPWIAPIIHEAERREQQFASGEGVGFEPRIERKPVMANGLDFAASLRLDCALSARWSMPCGLFRSRRAGGEALGRAW